MAINIDIENPDWMGKIKDSEDSVLTRLQKEQEDNIVAKFNFEDYNPTEAYAVFYKETPPEVNQKVTLNQVIRILKWLIKNGAITK